METLEQKEWHRHQLSILRGQTETGAPVSFLTVLPANMEATLPCIIALHGFTSRKEEWLELDGYTKGGNLIRALVDSGYAVVAIDLYGHGANRIDDTVTYDELAENGWEEFFHGSLASIEAVLNNYVKKGPFDQNRLGFLSYSVGGLFGFWLANRGVDFKVMALCVPPVDKDTDDEYAAYNNLDQLKAISMLIVAGEKDDIALEDTRWLYEQLPVVDKQLVSYPCGHSLPVDYVPVVAAWYRKRL